MIVQGSDGYWYQNPTFITPLAIVEFNDDGCILYRKGIVTWRTAVKVLTELGLKARRVDREPEDSASKVIDGNLVECSVFTLRVIKPIPTPAAHETRLSSPGAVDTEIIRFDQKRKCRDKASDDVGGD